jgi:putative serine protease PepD
MTDARPEPDKIEADPASEVRPEPVWARPTLPDPWGRPGDVAPDRHGVNEAQSNDNTVDQAGTKATGTAGSENSETAEDQKQETPVGQDSQPTPSSQQPQLPDYAPPGAQSTPQYSSPQYAPAQHSQAPQYPQYVAPQGFESPQGPAPTQPTPRGTGDPSFGQTAPLGQTAPAGQTAQAGQTEQIGQAEQFAQTRPFGAAGLFGQPTPADQSNQAGPGSPNPASGPPAPWYADASQPNGQAGGPNWPPSPYPVAGGGRKKGRGALIALLVGLSLLVGALGGVAGSALRDGVTDSSGRNPTISLPDPAPIDANRQTGAVTAVAAAVLPSVVSINVEAGEEVGTGSGFVIDAKNGYILTNNHVVTAGGNAAATSIEVVFQDGTEVPGKVVGLDSSYDLAVVKVTAKGLRQLQLGDSDSVRVGDPVVAIGAPLGLQGTVTTGIVSALNRPVAAGEGNKPAYINAIQTDAAINPGNSGGPLVDASGNVIAVNSAIARPPGALGASSGNIGLGFAIPSNQARRTAEQLIRTGKSSHPIIGVSLDSTYTGQGVKVSEQTSTTGVKPITENGPADQAGIKPGDVILKIDGRPVTEPDELIVAIRAQTPGETITLTVRRGNTENEVRVKLSEATD